MKLVMFVGVDCIDAVWLNSDKITQPGYVGSVKREMMLKHAEQIGYLPGEPEFLLIPMDQKAGG